MELQTRTETQKHVFSKLEFFLHYSTIQTQTIRWNGQERITYYMHEENRKNSN